MGNLINNNTNTKKASHYKRVDIVSIKMVRESSILYKNRKVSSPSDAYELIKDFIENSDRELLIACCLDTKNQPTSINVVSVGTLNSSLVHPRELFKPAILSNSASLIVAHNHPSGYLEPSNEDINITNRIKECGKLLGIDIIDHIIIGDENFISLKEKGFL
nr:JAB domain-containing protein [Desnuesiella massiliensis]